MAGRLMIVIVMFAIAFYVFYRSSKSKRKSQKLDLSEKIISIIGVVLSVINFLFFNPEIPSLNLYNMYLVFGSNNIINNTIEYPDAPHSSIPNEINATLVPTLSYGRKYAIPFKGYPSLGPQNAEVIIVEFGDFEDPYSKRWHDEVLPNLINSTIPIRYVFRNFPLYGIHPNAGSAAAAAYCADEQGAYWQYHNQLFSNQENGFGLEKYISFSDEIGIDSNSFKDCLMTNRYEARVSNDYDLAAKLGIRSTPTFFINGFMLIGAQSDDVFLEFIDKLINQN